MTLKGLERGPYGPKINENLIKCHLQRFCDNPGGFQKNWPMSKTVCYSSRKSPETDVFTKIGPGSENRVPKWTFSRKNKIQTRLARRPTLVMLCLKLWSIRGEGTVRVTKCVILTSV
jgi:hypothetical protein